MNWPQNNELILGSLQYNSVQSIQLVGVTGHLKIESSGDKGYTKITFPQLNPDSNLRYAYVLEITAK